MSERRLCYFERAKTRDDRGPLDDDDPEMLTGWRCIPVPPSGDPPISIPHGADSPLAFTH